MPIPIDLIVIIAATAISYACGFSKRYKVDIMGYIPTGLPRPKVISAVIAAMNATNAINASAATQTPRVDFLADILPDCVAIAIVSFAICLSLAKIYAKRHRYKVSPNQVSGDWAAILPFC